MGQIHILCSKGDVTVEWDPEDKESTDKAHGEWKRLKTEGYEFYEVQEAKGKRLTRFDKKLGKVIAAPGVAKPAERKTEARPKAMRGGPNDHWA